MTTLALVIVLTGREVAAAFLRGRKPPTGPLLRTDEAAARDAVTAVSDGATRQLSERPGDVLGLPT